MKSKLYVGCMHTVRKVFRSKTTPTQKTHGKDYLAVIGPFQTKAGADFMAQYGSGNPHCQCVADAERLIREISKAKVISIRG